MKRRLNLSIKSISNRTAALISGLLIILVLTCSVDVSWAQANSPVGDPEAQAPSIKAKSAILFSVDLDETMYAKNPDRRCDPYSITKLVSAVVAAENEDLSKEVIVSEKAADDIANGTTIDLVPGEKVSLEQLMYGALIESGNDAAYALAEGTSGSVSEFVKLMNKTVKEWGCTNTHFTNPMGLQNKNHYTTCNDLVIIMNHALANDKVRKVMTTRKYKMAATNKSNQRNMKSHVTLIQNKNSGVLGGKTGFWETTDCSVALAYNKKQLTAILVLLKDTENGRDKDTEKLLKFAHKVTPGFVIAGKGDDVGSVWVKHGEHTRVETEVSETIYAYPKEKSEDAVTTEFIPAGNLEAPLKKGEVVGTYKVIANDQVVAEKNVLLAEDVETGWITSYLYISNRMTLIGGGVLAALIIVITMFILRRKKNSGDAYQAKH